MAKQPKHPIQPLVRDEDGTIRFKENAIIKWLFQSGKINLNEIVTLPFPVEDLCQLDQLIGYSIGGYGELSYVSDKHYAEVAEMAEKLKPRKRKAVL